MSKKVLDTDEVRRLRRSGWTLQRIADRFNVSKSAVGQCLQAIERGKNKQVMFRAAGAMLNESIMSLQNLTRAADACNDLLDLIRRWMRGDAEATRILQLQDESNGTPRDLRKTLLDTASEIRRFGELQKQLYESLNDFNNIQSFQQEIVSIILEEMDHDQKTRTIARLKERGYVGRAARLTS